MSADGSPPSAYVVVQIRIHDRQGYRQYEAADHLGMLAEFGGTLVGADEDVDVVEGEWPYTRTVIIGFPSKELARAWHDSPAYQDVVGLRHASATSNLVIVGGFPG